jgi:hypothetical protein
VARVRRSKPHNPAKVHDRRSRDLPRNAEVAAVEVDDPLALEPREKIITLRSIRHDLLGRLHSHRQLDEAQYQGGRRFRAAGRRPSAARVPSIRPGSMSTAAGAGSRSRRASARPCCG